MYKPCEHKVYVVCSYAPEFETICCGNCGICSFPELFGNRLKKTNYSIVEMFL